MSDLTQTRLKELLSYDPDTGVFRWKKSRGKRWGGKVAGSATSEGYLSVWVCGTSYLVHRLAWLYVYGYFPEHEIDHMNGVRDDNRIANLRHVTQFCNRQNCAVSRNNTSGFPGVCWYTEDRRWRAYITINRKRIHIGYFKDPLEAALARFNFEVVDQRWHCNHRSNLAKAIKAAWPEFKGCHV